MANPIFEQFKMNNPYNQIIAEAQKLRQSFQGNPKEEVQKLLNSGAMTQAQFNQYSQLANQIVQFMK